MLYLVQPVTITVGHTLLANVCYVDVPCTLTINKDDHIIKNIKTKQ